MNHEEIKEEIKRYLRQIKMEHNIPKFIGHSKHNSKREGNTNTSLPQETRKISKNNITSHKNNQGKKRTKTKVSRKKE